MIKEFIITDVQRTVQFIRRQRVGAGFIVKLMYRADCVKGRGTWTVKRFKGNGLGKEEDVIFLTGVHTAIYTMLTNTKYFVSKIGV